MDLRPEDCIVEAWFEELGRRRTLLFDELAGARDRLFILGRLYDFPDHLFGWGEAAAFWETIKGALAESVISGLWRTVADKNNDSLTLWKLRSDILYRAKDATAKRLMEQLMDETLFLDTTERIRDRLDDLRHGSAGHISLKRRASAVLITPAELQQLLEAAAELLHRVSFGHRSRLLAPEFDESLGPQRAGVDALLWRIVEESGVIHAPEQDRGAFFATWRGWDARDRAAFNTWRAKFSLPEIP